MKKPCLSSLVISIIFFLLFLLLKIDYIQSATEQEEPSEQQQQEGQEEELNQEQDKEESSSETKNNNLFDFKIQREAIEAWGKQLTTQDLTPTSWKKQPQYMFDDYIHVLSDIFKAKTAKVNFILVGACDGTHDVTISQGYLRNHHWRGAFVEPFEINYHDLENYMKEHKVLDRTHLIHAAATSVCNSTTIKMKRPTFEEKNKSLPHWMRREIGAVVPIDKLDRPAMGGWIFEYVRCVTGPDILKDWAMALSRKIPKRKGKQSQKFPIRIRPHILKVDVEGHDYQVLSGFIADNVPNAELPLLISFEAKSIVKQFDLLKEQMEKRGYVMSSKIANDGFAMLQPKIFLKGGANGEKKEDAVDKAENEYIQKVPNPDAPERGKRKRKGSGKGSKGRKGGKHRGD